MIKWAQKNNNILCKKDNKIVGFIFEDKNGFNYVLKKDLAIIIHMASDLLLKDYEEEITLNELENALKIKQLLTVIDNATNEEIPF